MNSQLTARAFVGVFNGVWFDGLIGRHDANQGPFRRDERGEKLGDGFVKAARILVGQELCKSGQPPRRVLVQEAVECLLTNFGLILGFESSAFTCQPLQMN